MKVDWLIICGGIHGVHVAARLIGEAGVDPETLRIVDPADRLLARWRACTAATGMRYLRSPAVHHLDLDPWSLERWAGKRKRKRRGYGLFIPPRTRPSLDLFNAHCDRVIERYGLADLHVKDRARTCALGGDPVTVQLASGRALAAHSVVLALGASEQPHWPAWAPTDHARVNHIFQPGFDDWPRCDAPECIAVVGGGISAAQVALHLNKQSHRVHLIARHALRQHAFDSDPGWLGPKRMQRFQQEPDRNRRRIMINEARHRGSMTSEVRHALRYAIDHDCIGWHESQIERLIADGDRLVLRLADGTAIESDRVLLATGFAAKRPGGALVDALVASASLPCAGCGYPVVDAALRWHPRLYVTGPLAELELGPTSRNIAGARSAADRLVDVARRAAARARAAEGRRRGGDGAAI
ncbi:MAG: FAD/NAD(P)-binding protein [Acidobacteriota bacterium]